MGISDKKTAERTNTIAGQLTNTDLESSGIKLDIEFYLGEDILQGEKVPFYFLWKNKSIDKIKLHYTGFKSIVRLFNVSEYEKIDGGAIIRKEALKSSGYIGGTLSTSIATALNESPSQQAYLVLDVEYSNGTVTSLKEDRILHSARAFLVNQPASISVPLKKSQECIKINIEGAASVSIDIAPLQGGLELKLPPEVLTTMERFAMAVIEGMKALQKEYPQHSDLLSLFKMEDQDKQSFNQIIKSIQHKMEKIKEDKDFTEALAYVYVSAIMEQKKVKNSILIPMFEYLEAGTTTKAFLNSPFLCAAVPKGGGTLKCTLRFYDLLGHNCVKPIKIRTRLVATEDILIPLKELIQFSRGNENVSERC